MTSLNTDKGHNAEEEIAVARHHRRPQKERGKFFVIRQILNVMFMIGAVIGCVFYVKFDERMGAILIIIAMAFKMAECVLR